MPGKIKDLVGRVFGRLTVREFDAIRDRKAYWWCECACGHPDLISVRGTRMVQGRQVSCGCSRADSIVRRAARLQTPAKRRKAIAVMGGLARQVNRKPGRPRKGK